MQTIRTINAALLCLPMRWSGFRFSKSYRRGESLRHRSAWQDRYAGAIWDRYARILERAAMQCERELVACGLSADKGR